MEIKISKMPQELQETLTDEMETININLEQIAEWVFETGFREGYKKGLKAREK